jgi:predicted transcriptional regulator
MSFDYPLWKGSSTDLSTSPNVKERPRAGAPVLPKDASRDAGATDARVLTAAGKVPRLGVMEVHLKPELQAKVERVAAENQSEAAEYVQQLVENYVEHDAWFRQQVKKGLDQLDRGEFVSHEEMGARIEKMFPS